MQRQSILATRADPLEALCYHFNLRPTNLPRGITPGPTFDMFVVRDAHMPTHVLAATSSGQDPAEPPIMLPIDRTLYEQAFSSQQRITFPPTPPGSTAPIPHYITSASGQALVVALPVVPIIVPHVESLAVLLLFGMGLETDTNLLSWHLLPVEVVEEFPNAAAMSLILSRYPKDQSERIHYYCHGMWKNTLSLGLRSQRLMQILQTAFNVSAEGRKIRKAGLQI
ncbi:hypothetical protein CPB84DRAFT_1433354 [Gymnopilus junonius]|uniref:Uncharacterized protein n=1 Tax=Gymnopilus junonius TaxID=109634 RepID=A0A9P5NWZ2_GYMJU|nr:hypothetical protein CPB84DRAFT_1433354 [Gymnopilus junonius]